MLQHKDEAQLDMLEVGSLTQAFRSHVLFKHSHALLRKRVYSSSLTKAIHTLISSLCVPLTTRQDTLWMLQMLCIKLPDI